MDKVHVQNNAVSLIRKAARAGVSNLEGSAQNAASTFGERSFGAVSQVNTQSKLKSIIKLKQKADGDSVGVSNAKTSINLGPIIAGFAPKDNSVNYNQSFGNNRTGNDQISVMPRTAESPTRFSK